MNSAERIAKAFHESYERQAAEHNYTTRKASAVAWKDVPENNKNLMIAVVTDLLDRGIIVLTTQTGYYDFDGPVFDVETFPQGGPQH